MSNEDGLKAVEDITKKNGIELLELSGISIYNVKKITGKNDRFISM